MNKIIHNKWFQIFIGFWISQILVKITSKRLFKKQREEQEALMKESEEKMDAFIQKGMDDLRKPFFEFHLNDVDLPDRFERPTE